MGVNRNGWVKLYRSVLDNPIVSNRTVSFSIWCFLLLNATHEEYETMWNGKKRTLKPGELITSRKTISKQFNIPESTVYRNIKKFENEHLIEQQTCSRNTLIFIVNWQRYQENVTAKGTANEQQRNTNKNKEIYSPNLQNSLKQIFENVILNFPEDEQHKDNYKVFLNLVKDAGGEADIENRARMIQNHLDRLPEQTITFKEYAKQWTKLSKKD